MSPLPYSAQVRRDELHRPLRPGGAVAVDAAHPGLDEMDCREVRPRDAGRRLGLVVRRAQRRRRERRQDLPVGERRRGRSALRQGGEVCAGVDVGLHRAPDLGGDAVDDRRDPVGVRRERAVRELLTPPERVEMRWVAVVGTECHLDLSELACRRGRGGG